jgi:hypothetical protein
MPNTLCACQELRGGRLEERIGDLTHAKIIAGETATPGLCLLRDPIDDPYRDDSVTTIGQAKRTIVLSDTPGPRRCHSFGRHEERQSHAYAVLQHLWFVVFLALLTGRSPGASKCLLLKIRKGIHHRS